MIHEHPSLSQWKMRYGDHNGAHFLERVAAFLFVGSVAAGQAGVGSSPATSGQAPIRPTFSVREELVVLDVIVKDRKGSYVSDLTPGAFVIVEDGHVQTIQIFVAQDAPVTVGLLIDNSGSMLTARDRVIAAAVSFAEVSNPHDEIFALAFNDTVRAALPSGMPFTSDAAVLRSSLETAISARGRTALYDAVAAGLEHLNNGTQQRKVLVVVSDGDDNASATTFDAILRRAQAANTTIYAIALADPLEPHQASLKKLAEATGGDFFEPDGVAQVGEVLRHISRDIRNTYTIGYAPTNTARDGRVRRIRVAANAPDGRSLVVHAREGYIADER
jgi:VWFA-related protein